MRHTITINDQTYTAPSEWNELSFKQLLTWTKICSKKISADTACRLAAIFFLKIPKSLFFKLNAAQQVQLISEFDYLIEGNKLTNWLKPILKIKLKKFVGPRHRLTTSTIKEFRASELCYHAYQRTKDEKYLDQLLATLYRPKSAKPTDNDLRTPLSDLVVQKNARLMRRLHPAERKAILFNYEGCQLYIMKKFPEVFKNSVSKDIGALPDLEGMIKTVAGGKFGAFKETETTPLYLFLSHVQDEIIEAERNNN